MSASKQTQTSGTAVLDELLGQAKVWRAGETAQKSGIPTGFPMLDSLLPSRGWPTSSLTEILTETEGVGALALVLPAIARLTQNQWVVWVCPPYVPYAPALQAAGVVLERILIVEPEEADQADSAYKLWVFEQALRFPECAVALTWLDKASHRSLRRLALACEQGQTWGLIFRPERFAAQASPAALRVSLQTDAENAKHLHILKAQGGSRVRSCKLEL